MKADHKTLSEGPDISFTYFQWASTIIGNLFKMILGLQV